MAQHDEELSGVQKGAILLISLGPERSAMIFKHLKEEEIEDLTLEIANTRSVTPQVKEQVLEEFYQVCLAQQYIAEGGRESHTPVIFNFAFISIPCTMKARSTISPIS